MTVNAPQAPIIIESVTFTDEFTGSGGGGVAYLNGGVMDKMIATIDFYSLLQYSGILKFLASNKTININNQADTTNFIALGWRMGMTITVEGSGSNNGTYTIAAVSTQSITTVEALINEVGVSNASIFDDTPITALDLYYNLINNRVSRETYVSLTDKNSNQRFSALGLDASDTATSVPFLVSTSSMGWVTNEIADTTTGEVSGVTIKGRGITAHKQKFRITHEFFVAPLWIREQFNNFETITAPDYYSLNQSLGYIFRLNGKFSFENPAGEYTGGNIDTAGVSNWFNSNNQQTVPEYTFDSIAYTDVATSLPLDRLDTGKEVLVAITIKSRNSLFVKQSPSSGASTAFALGFIYNALDASRYINTPNRTLRQNLLNDRKFFNAFDSASNGEYFGTDYQVLKDISVTAFAAGQVTISFKVDFSAEIKALFAGVDITDRNYSFVITTQNVDIITTEQSDRVPILTAFDNADYDQDNGALVTAGAAGFIVYNYPNINTNPANQVRDYEGAPVYAKFPFRIKSQVINGISPSAKQIGMQVVLVKAGESDFVLEGQEFDCSYSNKLNAIVAGQPVAGIQLDFNTTRGLISYAGDPYNTISLVNDASYNSGVNLGYVFNYAFVLRYETWLSLIQKSSEFEFPLFSDIADPTERWFALIVAGWTIKLKFYANIEGYDGWVTNLYCYTDIQIKALGSAADAGPVFTAVTKYYDFETATEVQSILTDKKTLIITTYTRTSGVISGTPWGYLFETIPSTGSIFNRRFASSEYDSESDSPFTSPGNDPAKTSGHESANVAVNLFGTSYVTVSTIYDDSILNLARNNPNMAIITKLGFK